MVLVVSESKQSKLWEASNTPPWPVLWFLPPGSCLQYLPWGPNFMMTVICLPRKPFSTAHLFNCFKDFIYFLNVWQCLFCLHSYMCTTSLPVPIKISRPLRIPGTGSKRWLWTTTYVLGAELESSATATGTLNCWAIFGPSPLVSVQWATETKPGQHSISFK